MKKKEYRRVAVRKDRSAALYERSADGPEGQSLLDYGAMSAEEFVDHAIDENGLAQFIDTQQEGVPRDEWDWFVITRDLQAFSHGLLTFSPEYLEELYKMQVARQG